MKTSKKIFAALLAVMMIVMMIPITASAATTYTYTLQGRAGYGVTVYQIAEYNETTGKYSAINADIQAILDAGNPVPEEDSDAKRLLETCDGLSDLTGGTVLDFDEELNPTKAVVPGAYYVKVTKTPAGVKSVTNSVFTLPTNEGLNTITVNVASKVEDDQPTSTKKIVSGENRVDAISQFIDKDVTFELTGDLTGTASQKLKSYVFTDTMSAGLKFKSVDTVDLVKDDGTTKKDIKSNVTVSSVNPTTHVFTITLKDAVLNASDTYDYSKVVVTYTAELNSSAVIGDAGNPNKAHISYTDSYNNQADTEDTTVKVYTAKLNVLKVDAADNKTPLPGAKFTLYKEDGTTVADNGAEVETGADGKATFTGLAAGTYKLKETGAPDGYTLNADVVTITVSANGTINNEADYTVTVKDSKVVVPQTGGMGTMIFTIVGLSLIACAGVLFVVVRRKKASK